VSQTRKRLPPPIGLPDRAAYSLNETAQLFNLSWRTVLRLVHERELRAMKIGQQWRISRHELERFMAEREEAAS
jgi:excisionase family DNA binding protein